MSAILFHFDEEVREMFTVHPHAQNEGVVQYLTTQPGHTDLITMSTHDKIYWLISIFYWLLIGWRPMRTQAGLPNTQPHLHTGDNNQNANSCWCQHVTTTWQQQLTWTEQMKQKWKQNGGQGWGLTWWMWNRMKQPWTNKQNKPNTATQEMARRIRSDIQKSLFLEILTKFIFLKS